MDFWRGYGGAVVTRSRRLHLTVNFSLVARLIEAFPVNSGLWMSDVGLVAPFFDEISAWSSGCMVLQNFWGHLCQTQVPGVPVPPGSQTPGWSGTRCIISS